MRRMFLGLAGFGFVLSLVVGNAWGAATYTLTDLGVLSGDAESHAFGISASGQVVGYS